MLRKIEVHMKAQMNPQMKKEPLNLFLMAKEEPEGFLLEDEEEGEVDLVGELMSAVEEINKLKLK